MHYKTRFASTLIFLLLLSAVATLPAQADSGGLRYTIMVSKFENQSNWRGQFELGRAWSTILTDTLNQSGKFIVIAENDMREEAGKEQLRALSGETAQGKKTPVMGQMTPAQLLVKGAITHFQHGTAANKGGVNIGGIGFKKSKETTEINATLYIVDSTTGMVVASKSVVGTAEKKKKGCSVRSGDVSGGHESVSNDNIQTAMSNAVDEAVAWMVGQVGSIPWRGTIVHVEEDFIYINRGSREGVEDGAVFSVGESKLIRDPDSGEVLDEIVSERAQIQAVRVKEKTTVCRITDGKMSSIYKGMGVSPAS